MRQPDIPSGMAARALLRRLATDQRVPVVECPPDVALEMLAGRWATHRPGVGYDGSGPHLEVTRAGLRAAGVLQEPAALAGAAEPTLFELSAHDSLQGDRRLRKDPERTNPERVYTAHWKRLNRGHGFLHLILSPDCQTYAAVSARDAAVAATIVQWLGTNVGGSFVFECEKAIARSRDMDHARRDRQLDDERQRRAEAERQADRLAREAAERQRGRFYVPVDRGMAPGGRIR